MIGAVRGFGLRLVTLAGAALFLTAFGSGERIFAPGPDLWEHWTRHDPESRKRIDHGAWNELLARHVRTDRAGVNRVDYGAFSDDDRAQLDGYIARLAELPIGRYDRDEQFAYWVNLYNALTVDLILDRYPVESIRDIDISPGLFAVGPWDKELVAVEGKRLSLNDIEHRILRPIWQDPRLHYAVNCAAIGCPNLREQAYESDGLNETLERAARDYVNDPRGVTIMDGQVTVSRIYDWFIEDFGASEQGVMRHLMQYADPALAGRLAEIGALSDTQYDWSLNDVR